MESDDMVRLFLLTPNDNPIKMRFTTEVMTPYFRPVDYGNLHIAFVPRVNLGMCVYCLMSILMI